MKTYEFEMSTLSEDTGICTRNPNYCAEEITLVCTPVSGEKHLFMVNKTDVEVIYDDKRQPTIIINKKVFAPNGYLDYTDTVTWVLETLSSAAAMLLTGEDLKDCVKEFAYEIREGFDSAPISAKVLIEAYSDSGTDQLNQLFKTIKNEFQDMAWLLKPLMLDLNILLIETLVKSGIDNKIIATSLNSVYTFEELSEMMQIFNENEYYEYQIFLSEIIRSIPQEDLDKRWEL